MSTDLSSLLRCPATKQPLRLATPEELSSFDSEHPEGGWITEDLSRLYPIRDGFPILITSESIEASSRSSPASDASCEKSSAQEKR